ncbi:MAG: carboxyl-terminal processing protease [Gammaproteobacteria bacterium]|nr:MAG: carboxyl-terminal processing protease [Gammaproteobacteria bacterium]TND05528.1 MAG: carboxyl-terminal processing protease [Gammaproteobacteria bacterium]
MKTKVRNILLLALGLLVGVSLTIGQGVLAERESGSASPLPLQELRTFTEVFGKIKEEYVEEVDDKKLLEDAVRGMLAGLDPHSAFLDEEAFRELRVGTSGEFGGLGIEVGMEDGFVRVIAPIDDTPAARAGVKAGDLIIRLDEAPVKGMSLADAVKMMRGKPGSKIRLTIVREGADKPLEITIVRDVIQVKSIKSRILDAGYGYVRITQFQSHSGEDMVEAISALKKENDGSLKGMVLDLRNNPGGVLTAAVTVSDAFLEQGMIVYTEGRRDSAQLSYKATPVDVLKGTPMVVLVNGGSASASEIVAGALQDHGRAIVMGTKTFGKGSVQTILPMVDGSALKLTTARYFTPSGRSIQAQGIEPDVVTENVVVTAGEAPAIEPVKEANLSGHLENGTAKPKKPVEDDAAATTTPATPAKPVSLAAQDYQLYEALNLLKGLNILNKQR